MKQQELPEWARQAIQTCLQELQNEGYALREIHVDDLADFVYGEKPSKMTLKQFEKDIEPLVKEEGRRHGLQI